MRNFSCHFSRVIFALYQKKNFLYTNLLSYYTMYIGNMARHRNTSEDDRSDDKDSFSSSDEESASKKHTFDYDYNEIKVNNYLFVLYLFLVLFTFMYYFIERSFHMGGFRISRNLCDRRQVDMGGAKRRHNYEIDSTPLQISK